MTLGMAIVAGISAWHRREVIHFVVILFVESVWVIVLLLEYLSAGIQAKLVWHAARYPMALAVHIAIVTFAYSVTLPKGERMPAPLSAAMWLTELTAVAAAVAASLGFEGPLFVSVDRVPGPPFGGARVVPSTLAVAYSAVGLALFAWAAFTMARYAARQTSAKRKAVLYILSSFAVMATGVGFELAGRGPVGFTGIAPVWFSIAAFVCAYGLFSQSIFGSVTTARRAVMDTLLDPVFVLGKGDEVIDCNAAARTLLGDDSGDAVGSSARSLFARWPSAVVAALDFPEAETEFDLPDKDGIPRRSYRITVASNSAKDRSSDWKLLVFNDISGQKTDARDLAASNEELEFWVRQRTAALRQEVAQRTEAEERLRELNEEMAETQRELLWTLSEVVESRSRETAYHVVRVGEYARIIASAAGLPAEEVEIITTAAPMHDVGKIAIPDAILGKPGRLTDEEREEMKRHTVVGKDILGSSSRPLLKAAAVIAYEHHERWDGKGYPRGISGDGISLSGRIVAICDVFDALYNKRVYKDAWPLDKVLELFKADSGTAFDPALVGILFDRLESILEVSRRYADVPELAAP